MSARIVSAALLLALLFSGCSAPAVPEGSSPQTQKALSCTLTFSCAPVLDQLDALDADKTSLIPEDGVLLSVDNAAFASGDTVFDLTLREIQARKLHIEFTTSPVYGSVYIEGIFNLYEFDCGPLSGWVYTVNGLSPSVGCGEYALEDGDAVQWLFVCDRTGPGQEDTP